MPALWRARAVAAASCELHAPAFDTVCIGAVLLRVSVGSRAVGLGSRIWRAAVYKEEGSGDCACCVQYSGYVLSLVVGTVLHVDGHVPWLGVVRTVFFVRLHSPLTRAPRARRYSP